MKKQQEFENKKQPIYIRITVNGKRIELSAKREVDPLKWNSHSGRGMGTKEEIKTLNAYLDTFQMKLYEAQRQLLENGKPFTAETLKNKMTGKEERPRMLIEIIQHHNDSIKTLIGLDYSRPTWVKYNTTQKHIEEFLRWKYQITDINIRELNFEFINDFEFYLKSQKKIDVNTNARYIKNVKKIVNECVVKNWLDKDPFMGYKIKTKHTEREFLNESELKDIEEKEFVIERLNHVRDIFLFSCYTGLASIDIFNLTKENISIGIDGEKWIFTHRQKTKTASRIPLFATGNLTLRSHSLVNKVIYDEQKNKATGVEVIDIETNEVVEFYAKVIFLNVATLATAFILLNSTSNHFPNGLGNGSDQVGRNLMDHHKCKGLSSDIEGFEDKYYYGRTPTGINIPRFRNIHEKRNDYVRGFSYQGQASRQGWERDILPDSIGASFKESLAIPGPWKISFTGYGEGLPYSENRVVLNTDKKDKWGRNIQRVDCEFKDNEKAMQKDMASAMAEMLDATGCKNINIKAEMSYPGNANHEIGTARMGNDPQRPQFLMALTRCTK